MDYLEELRHDPDNALKNVKPNNSLLREILAALPADQRGGLDPTASRGYAIRTYLMACAKNGFQTPPPVAASPALSPATRVAQQSSSSGSTSSYGTPSGLKPTRLQSHSKQQQRHTHEMRGVPRDADQQYRDRGHHGRAGFAVGTRHDSFASGGVDEFFNERPNNIRDGGTDEDFLGAYRYECSNERRNKLSDKRSQKHQHSLPQHAKKQFEQQQGQYRSQNRSRERSRPSSRYDDGGGGGFVNSGDLSNESQSKFRQRSDSRGRVYDDMDGCGEANNIPLHGRRAVVPEKERVWDVRVLESALGPKPASRVLKKQLYPPEGVFSPLSACACSPECLSQSFVEYMRTPYGRSGNWEASQRVCILFMEEVPPVFKTQLKQVLRYVSVFFQRECYFGEGVRPNECRYFRRNKHVLISEDPLNTLTRKFKTSQGLAGAIGVCASAISSYSYQDGSNKGQAQIISDWASSNIGDSRPGDCDHTPIGLVSFASMGLRDMCTVLTYEIARHIAGIDGCVYYACIFNPKHPYGGIQGSTVCGCSKHLNSNHTHTLNKKSDIFACPIDLRKLLQKLGFDVLKRYESMLQCITDFKLSDDSGGKGSWDADIAWLEDRIAELSY